MHSLKRRLLLDAFRVADALVMAGAFAIALVVTAEQASPQNPAEFLAVRVKVSNALLFLAVFAQARIYSNAALQAVYVVVSFYGWHEWRHGGKDHGRLAVSRTPPRWLVSLAGAALLASLAIGLFLEHHTDAALPFPDAATTAASLAAQWMTTRKWLESWLVWIGVDAVYVAMYVSQGLFPTAALYAAFLVLAPA